MPTESQQEQTQMEVTRKRKMVVNSTVSEDDRRFSKACELYKAAGYGLRDSQAFEEIHCQKDSCSWLSNGFLQCFTSVEGKRARVLVYFPSQELQPHKHDIDEEFLITHGAVDLWTWPQKSMKEDSSQEDGVHMCHQRLTKGSRFGVPAGMVHCLRADSVQGLVFHELVAEDSFQKRSTEFMDKKLQKMPSVYTDKLVLITGANRGLGLGFAKAFAVAGAKVIACCRDPSKADDLAALTPKPLIVPLDIANEASVKELPSILSSFGITSLDYLVNNAGISSPNHPNDPIVTAEAEIMKSVFNVNVMGTIMVTQTCLPLLEAASTKCVVNLSSQLASIDHCWGIQNRYGGVASYRISRAANNMAMRCFGGELRERGFVFISMSPGHVATDMGYAGNRVPPLSVEQSVGGMLDVIGHLAPEDNGKFLQYDGVELPW